MNKVRKVDESSIEDYGSKTLDIEQRLNQLQVLAESNIIRQDES
jgi:hypothetical protein